jgi:transcriptional regulator with XRE-family HTH domain
MSQGYLGRLLVHHRARRNMSLQDVADEADTSKAHVWDIERGGAKNPSAELIFRLSVALDCPPIEILNAAIADTCGTEKTPCKATRYRAVRKRRVPDPNRFDLAAQMEKLGPDSLLPPGFGAAKFRRSKEHDS